MTDKNYEITNLEMYILFAESVLSFYAQKLNMNWLFKDTYKYGLSIFAFAQPQHDSFSTDALVADGKIKNINKYQYYNYFEIRNLIINDYMDYDALNIDQFVAIYKYFNYRINPKQIYIIINNFEQDEFPKLNVAFTSVPFAISFFVSLNFIYIIFLCLQIRF